MFSMFSMCKSCVKSWRNQKWSAKKKKKDKTFMNKCVWEEINFPSEKDDWQKIEKK